MSQFEDRNNETLAFQMLIFALMALYRTPPTHLVSSEKNPKSFFTVYIG